MHPTATAEIVPPALDLPGSLDQLLTQTVTMGGSDLHLTVGIAPCVRLHGSLKPFRTGPICGRRTPSDSSVPP